MEEYRKHVRQIAVYCDPEFFRQVEEEARERRRKIGPTALEILKEYFERKKSNYVRTRSTRKTG